MACITITLEIPYVPAGFSVYFVGILYSVYPEIGQVSGCLMEIKSITNCS